MGGARRGPERHRSDHALRRVRLPDEARRRDQGAARRASSRPSAAASRARTSSASPPRPRRSPTPASTSRARTPRGSASSSARACPASSTARTTSGTSSRRGLAGARPTRVLNHPPDQTTDRIAERWGLLGPRSTITTACSSSATSLGYAADLIRHGFCDVVVTGGADTFARLTHGGFNALRSVDPDPAGRSICAARGSRSARPRAFSSSRRRATRGTAARACAPASSATASRRTPTT